MHRLGKVVPPKRHILKNISLSFFPGAKIGVLGLNGSGKSTLLRIMAGIDTDIEGEARPQPGLKIGYLPQEPQLNLEQTVRESVEEAVAEVVGALKRLDEVYALYADPDADFDKLAAEQGKLEEIIQAHDGHNLNAQLERAADALRLPEWDAKIATLSGGERRRVAQHTVQMNAIPGYTNSSQLFDPQTNITIGTGYLEYVYQMFGRNRILSSAAYNAGPSRVNTWLGNTQGQVDAVAFVESIPFSETRRYVKNVLAYDAFYRYFLHQPAKILTDAEWQRCY
jgi:ABC-type lipoprotein export system ATPase subunit